VLVIDLCFFPILFLSLNRVGVARAPGLICFRHPPGMQKDPREFLVGLGFEPLT
jgi:hypothetical protein